MHCSFVSLEDVDVSMYRVLKTVLGLWNRTIFGRSVLQWSFRVLLILASQSSVVKASEPEAIQFRCAIRVFKTLSDRAADQNLTLLKPLDVTLRTSLSSPDLTDLFTKAMTEPINAAAAAILQADRSFSSTQLMHPTSGQFLLAKLSKDDRSRPRLSVGLYYYNKHSDMRIAGDTSTTGTGVMPKVVARATVDSTPFQTTAHLDSGSNQIDLSLTVTCLRAPRTR